MSEPVADEVFGFCHWAGRPGDLVALDSFYIGKLKGVGKVYQLTAVDTATRWAIIQIVLGPPTAEHTRRFITHVQRHFRRLGWPVRAVLSDNGPEYVATRFRDHLGDLGVAHHRRPPGLGGRRPRCWPPAWSCPADGARRRPARRSGTRARGGRLWPRAPP
ncbi:MAG: DDE-type integrase/transposase/recombinase [Actinobacteria bacterium]|nr:DDE-type integrase/transposase/recombinase [Actinomycetota bacterium]